MEEGPDQRDQESGVVVRLRSKPPRDVLRSRERLCGPVSPSQTPFSWGLRVEGKNRVGVWWVRTWLVEWGGQRSYYLAPSTVSRRS